MLGVNEDDVGLGDAFTASPSLTSALSPAALVWRRLRRDRVAIVALVAVLLVTVVALTAPLLVDLVGAPGPNVQNSATLSDIGLPSGPSSSHLLGVDELGRDVFSRVVYGARISLSVAFIATGLAAVLGTLVGLCAGFFEGVVDSLLSRTMDVVLAFPVMLLALGMASACSTGKGCAAGLVKPGFGTVVFVLTFAGWPRFGRLVRGQTLSLRHHGFVDAARGLGSTNKTILFTELLPNLVGVVTVYATLMVPTNILFEAALSFLGVGIQPPNPSWGAMIAEAIPVFQSAWWFLVFPGMALIVTSLAFNLLGDALTDAVGQNQ